VPLQGFELLPVLQAYDEVWGDGLLQRNRRFKLLAFTTTDTLGGAAQGLVDIRNDSREF
jgi:hypothetical protein